MDLPTSNSDYRERNYWDARYTTEDNYDWFTGYPAFKHLICRDLRLTDSILMLGCGNSNLSEDMYNDGYRNIVNTDFSGVVIDKMADRHQDKPEMTWRVMDITQMDFSPNTFDVVVEKGTLDALMVHEKDPWNICEQTKHVIDKVLTQVNEVLKPGGKFLSITFAQPNFRRPLYARSKYGWSVNAESFGQTFHFFYFRTVKGESLCERDKQMEIEREKKDQETNSSIKFLEEQDRENFILDIEL